MVEGLKEEDAKEEEVAVLMGEELVLFILKAVGGMDICGTN